MTGCPNKPKILYMDLITHLGDPVLRKKTAPIDDVFSQEVSQIIDQLVATLIKENGVGIAGPQIGELKQIFIVAPNQVIEAPYDTIETGLVVINPSITLNTKEVQLEWEGCLSIPGIRGLVPRQCDITITYTNRHGEIKSEQYVDFVARIFLHEFDHLNGVLFIDRIENMKTDLMTDDYYKKLVEEQEQ